MLKCVSIASLTVLLLNGCVTSGQGTDLGCTWAKPIYVSRLDQFTDGTARQIQEHNETGAERCGWKRTGK